MSSYEERILKAIEDSEVGLTTVDVAKQAGVSKTTAIKYLSVLKSQGRCEFVEVGPSKLWRPSEPGEVRINPEDVESLEDFRAALKDRCGVDMPHLKLSVVAQLEEISEDVTVSLSFKVKPENVGTFMSLMKRCVRQTE